MVITVVRRLYWAAAVALFVYWVARPALAALVIQ